MCGICGIYHYGTSAPASDHLVRAMTDALVHRGPDDDGYFFDGPLGMGMRRLSIIDLEGGSQPISGEDGSVTTVFNGEIYNFRELRRDLQSRGHVFRTLTDTEAAVHAFEEWGFASLQRLNGMFGIALWDARTRSLVLARDPFGIKPLYYSDDGATLRFSSEIRSILRDDGVPRRVDGAALDLFLSYTFVPSPATAFEGIKKVPPGHALVCSPAGCEVQRFSFMTPRPVAERDEAVLVERLQTFIEQAVQRQMVADVPVGALLSGGVDSTTTATLMSRLAHRPIDTFTVGFSADTAFDETEFARATAQRLGSRHHEVLISADDYVEFLPESVWHLEDLVATDSTLAYAHVCRLARQHVKVVLSGQGADEPFAGYPRHLGERYGWLLWNLPSAVVDRVLSPAVDRLPRNERLKRALHSLDQRDPALRRDAVWTIVDASLKQILYRPDVQPSAAPPMPAGRWASDVRGLDGLSQMLYLDSRFSLSDNLLLYGDKLSMAVSLEARVPLLDLELMRFVEGLPPRFKIKGLTRKYILRRAVAKWIPDDVLRRKKIPFQSPIDKWLRRDMTAQVRDLLLSPDSGSAQYFRRATMDALISAHVDGREDYKRVLLGLIVFELWHRQFIAPSGDALRRRIATSGAEAERMTAS